MGKIEARELRKMEGRRKRKRKGNGRKEKNKRQEKLREWEGKLGKEAR